MATYLITGCSQGIGLALAAHLASLPTIGTVFASARRYPPELKSLVESASGKVVYVHADVEDESSVQAAAEAVEKALDGKGLDVLVNNVGMNDVEFGSVLDVTAQQLKDIFSVNVISVQLVTKAFLPLLRKGDMKKIVNMSTTVSSNTWGAAGRWDTTPAPGYKVTKASTNQLTVIYSRELAQEGFTVFALSPGWIQTALGGSHADLTLEQAIPEVARKILESGKEKSGCFLNVYHKGYENVEGPNQYDGLDVPW